MLTYCAGRLVSRYCLLDTNLPAVPGIIVVHSHSTVPRPALESTFEGLREFHPELAGAATMSASAGCSPEVKVCEGIGKVA